MEENTRLSVGVDVGTRNIRVVQGQIARDGRIAVLGYSEGKSAGMRRGMIREMRSPGEAVDACLKEVEAMSGREIKSATLGINGVSISGTKSTGMVRIMPDHQIEQDDIERLQEMAISGSVQQNRRVLDVIPYEYVLDGQRGIREPMGMQGARLEIKANILSVLNPEYENLLMTFSGVTEVKAVAPTVVAAAEAVLSGQQRENGVGVIDLGDSTTSVAIYDEGELQYMSVIPIGSNDVTKDLSTVLQTIPEVAEEIKLRFITGKFGENEKDISIKRGREEMTFSRATAEEVVEARLEEIFEKVRERLRDAGYDKRLPEGLILVGGGAKMRDIEVYARSQVELAVRIGVPGQNLIDPDSALCKPEYAAAIGLMLRDVYAGENSIAIDKKKSKKAGLSKIFGFFR